MIETVTQALTSLARLTLRQLRQMASDLGVTLYSRKSKQDLVSAIAERQDRVSESPAVTETELTESSRTDAKTRVVFLPRDPQWAYVFWEITDLDRKRAQGDGAGHLSLRLADVTGMRDGSSHPHTLQEVPVDSHSTEWYLPVPLCDRDYRVELGYRAGASWVSLAFSSVARVPALHPPRLPAFPTTLTPDSMSVSTRRPQHTSAAAGWAPKCCTNRKVCSGTNGG